MFMDCVRQRGALPARPVIPAVFPQYFMPEPERVDHRSRELANHSYGMIKHALTFSKVHGIVFTTYSVLAIENEGVVNKALKFANEVLNQVA